MTISEETLAQLRHLAMAALDRIDLGQRTARAFAGAPPPSAVLAVGKSAGPMMDGALRVLPRDFAGPLVAIVPDGSPAPSDARVQAHRASHPYPDHRAAANAQHALLHGAPLWLLLSGGGSACLGAPHPSMTVEQLAQLTRALMLHGASIRELNTCLLYTSDAADE